MGVSEARGGKHDYIQYIPSLLLFWYRTSIEHQDRIKYYIN